MSKNPEIILIIEDDHDVRVCFRQTLEDLGFRIYTTANGSDALKLLKKIELPKLIILDLNMPIMDGEEFLRMKDLDPKYVNIPVLIVTAHGDKYKVIDSKPHLKKPVDLQLFIDKVLACLKSAALTD